MTYKELDNLPGDRALISILETRGFMLTWDQEKFNKHQLGIVSRDGAGDFHWIDRGWQRDFQQSVPYVTGGSINVTNTGINPVFSPMSVTPPGHKIEKVFSPPKSLERTATKVKFDNSILKEERSIQLGDD